MCGKKSYISQDACTGEGVSGWSSQNREGIEKHEEIVIGEGKVVRAEKQGSWAPVRFQDL